MEEGERDHNIARRLLNCFVRVVGEVMGGRDETHGHGEHIQDCFASGKGDHG